MPRLITKVFAQILALAGLAVFVEPVSAQGKPEPTARWEYRVLTKSDVLDLGNKDLAAGLNKIGNEGWELVATDSAFIFKRHQGLSRPTVAALKARVALAESEVDQWRERVAWTTRMTRKGFAAEQGLTADKARLQAAELVLEMARKELDAATAVPKAPEKLPVPTEQKLSSPMK